MRAMKTVLVLVGIIVWSTATHAQIPVVVSDASPTAPQQALSTSPLLDEAERAWLDALNTRAAYAKLLVQSTERLALIGDTMQRLGKELLAAANELGRLQAEISSSQLTQEESDLKAKIERRHPGYTWDPKTGAFTMIRKD